MTDGECKIVFKIIISIKFFCHTIIDIIDTICFD